jgi:imidazolonepropionase-like amidohydrolase
VGEWIHDGLPRADAVRAVTSVGADALGIGHRAGLLAPGRTADLLLFDADPFEGTTRLRAVWLDGVPRRGEGKP